MTNPIPRRETLVLAVCCLSLFMAGLDTTAVNIALPAIQHDLNATVSGLQWAIDGYTVALAGCLMLAGSTADRIGRRRVFQAGLVVFTLGSLACSLAPGLPWLIAFRVTQGVGASMLNPVALSILTNTFTDARARTRAIGIWGATIGLSLAFGPVVGGLLVGTAGWRSVFWINIPVGVAAVTLTAIFVPESKATNARRPDPIGQILVITALVSVVSAIIEGGRRGYTSAPVTALFVFGLVAVAALLRYEHRRDQPLVDPRCFRSAPFAGAIIAAVAAFVALSGFLFLNTLYLQDVRGYSAVHAGLLTVPMAAATAIISPISGRITARGGPRPTLVAAGGLVTSAALILTTIGMDTPMPLLLIAYLVFGVGFGLVNAPITTTAMSGMPRARAGVAGAIATTARQVGNSLGVAVLGSIVSTHASGPLHDSFPAASRIGWWTLAGCGALVAALGVRTTRGESPHLPAGQNPLRATAP